ncbi:sorting nexin-2-like isoform X4 [Gordionus sp. m RMFG-2023]|uniref:sorting nexin-2-like isoform X4 n=1 Tax=Gordionus sp. m RMFG-2023 TaxID=3053472 RepID=UPI0031FCDC42
MMENESSVNKLNEEISTVSEVKLDDTPLTNNYDGFKTPLMEDISLSEENLNDKDKSIEFYDANAESVSIIKNKGLHLNTNHQIPGSSIVHNAAQVQPSVSHQDSIKIHNVPGVHQNEGEEWHVIRRFSDFLGLHEKLEAKYSPLGYVVPPPPSKSLLGMTKLKIGSKDDTFSADFAERRRAALERYINRTANHWCLMKDPCLHEFLQAEGELPRAVNTSSLSSNQVMKMINRVASDITSKLALTNIIKGSSGEDSDHWFEDMQNQIENLDSQMRKLHASVDALVHHRKELSTNTANFSKSLAMLSNSEENSALSRALSQLAQVEERLEQITGSDILNLNPSLQTDQFSTDTTDLMVGLAHNDYFTLAETLNDYCHLVGIVKRAFETRVRSAQKVSNCRFQVDKKEKEIHSLGNNGSGENGGRLRTEHKEWEDKLNVAQKDFELISENIKKEVCRFEKERIKEFKDTFILYLQNLLKAQQQIVKCWEAFLPEAKVIAINT